MNGLLDPPSGEATPPLPNPRNQPRTTEPKAESESEPRNETKASAITAFHIHTIIGLLAALLGSQLIGLASTRSVSHWDYSVVSPSDTLLEMELDRLGSEGWELVFARRATTDNEYFDKARYEMIFRRPTR